MIKKYVCFYSIGGSCVHNDGNGVGGYCTCEDDCTQDDLQYKKKETEEEQDNANN